MLDITVIVYTVAGMSRLFNRECIKNTHILKVVRGYCKAGIGYADFDGALSFLVLLEVGLECNEIVAFKIINIVHFASR